MGEQISTVGLIVLYRLTAQNAVEINRRRTSSASISDRIRVGTWPIGAQVHMGNSVQEGDVFPLLITKVWGDNADSVVNGQLFLDGNDVMWLTSVHAGEGAGFFS